MNRIAAYSTYLPRFVLTREAAREAWPQISMAPRSKSVPSLDEDPLTMAAQAGLRLLEAAGVAGESLAGVLLATSSSPYAVKSGAAIVADYLNAPPGAFVADHGAGSQAGLAALLAALRDTELAARGPILVIGADALRGPANDPLDLGLGAAAAAFLVAELGFASLADFTFGYSSYANVWRPAGELQLHRYDDDRFERHSGWGPQMAAGLARLRERAGSEPDLYALGLPPNGRGDAALAGIDAGAERLVGSELAGRCGDTGCAAALLSLAAAFDAAAPGQTIAAAAFGQGAGTVGALIEVESAPPTGTAGTSWEPLELSYVQYAKHRGLLPMTELPSFGAPYGVGPAWERSKHAVVGLHGGRCTNCGSLNFPPRDYCLDCRGQEFEGVALPRTGTVVTYNLQFVVGIGPEEAPLPICTAQLDGEPEGRYGGKVAALVTDADPEAVEIGAKVELIPRRGDVEEGVVKYGWKFRPREVAA